MTLARKGVRLAEFTASRVELLRFACFKRHDEFFETRPPGLSIPGKPPNAPSLLARYLRLRSEMTENFLI